MALPNSRETLKQWCLRSLGEPVIQINVDQKQLEDRLDEAFDYFQTYHFDAIEKINLQHRITASSVTLAVTPSGSGFASGSTLHGVTSSVTCTFYDIQNSVLRFTGASGTFTTSEILSNASGSVTAQIGTTAQITGDKDNKYIPLTDSILSIEKLMKAGVASFDMFDVKYQFSLQFAGNLRNMDMITYDMMQRHVALIEEEFKGIPPLRFNRFQNKLYIDLNWDTIGVGSYFVVECYRILDPADFPRIYGSKWLRDYTTELFRRQWGDNLSKYSDIQLPGGVKLDGDKIRDRADRAIEKLHEQARKEFSLPIDFFVG